MVKEIVSQPIQNQKLNKSDDSKNNCNIDFLELILKNIDTEEISQANIVSSEKQENQNSEKQNIDSIVENLMNLDSFILFFQLFLKFFCYVKKKYFLVKVDSIILLYRLLPHYENLTSLMI